MCSTDVVISIRTPAQRLRYKLWCYEHGVTMKDGIDHLIDIASSHTGSAYSKHHVTPSPTGLTSNPTLTMLLHMVLERLEAR